MSNIISTALAYISENRGFTVTRDFEPFTGTAYVVGGLMPPVIVPQWSTDPAVLAGKLGMALGSVDLSRFTPDGWGGWPSGDEYYVDAVTFVQDRDTAIELGRQRGELAIGQYVDGEYVTDIEL